MNSTLFSSHHSSGDGINVGGSYTGFSECCIIFLITIAQVREVVWGVHSLASVNATLFSSHHRSGEGISVGGSFTGFSECHIIALITIAQMPKALPTVHGTWVRVPKSATRKPYKFL